MSRQSTAPNRALSLPEELEKLEQSITLTLQEIDANFSRAHRIVTSSILPIVQQYATHSNSVWESSRFWKEFFEASANISLTGYEEAAESDAAADDTLRSFETDNDDQTRSSAANEDVTGSSASSALERPNSRFDHEEDGDAEDSFLMDSPTTTARMTPRPTIANHPPSSPQYDNTQTTEAAATPHTRPSPFMKSRQPTGDPLLHRVLDKNYRVQATPRTARRSPVKQSTHVASNQRQTKPEPTRTLHPALDSSPFSPGMQAPALRAEIFGPSSARKQRRGAPGTPLAPSGPRTPGVSVQRSMRGRAREESGFTPGAGTGSRGTLFGEEEQQTRPEAGAQPQPQQQQYQQEWYDSDDETADASAFFGAMSPPKTVALNFPPRLIQTPAREASRRMVDDLMRTAGGESATDEMEQPEYEELDMELGEDSPSVVRVARDVDDSF